MKRPDLAAAAHFRVTCTRCNQQSPEYAPHTITVWTARHEAEHRTLDAVANGPLLDAG